MHNAVFSGKLYEAEFGRLNKQIAGCFESGPGALPVDRRDKNVRAAIVPSCNYLVSGGAAAWAYKEIAETKFPEAYIIIGSTDLGTKTYLSLEDFETPLGLAKNMKMYLREDDVVIDESIHRMERGIEMQLPFLQHISKERFDNVRIIPILVGNSDFDSLRGIANAISRINKKYIVIASCNLSYYGDRLWKVPFRYNIGEEIKAADMNIIELITNGDLEGFWKLATRFNMRDRGVICVLLEILRGRSGRLLMYDDSKKFTGTDNFISYCSMVFE